ncbi:hypothetical protein B0H63DRAFT_468351 [Podospora didyma]|uniref:Uncharacterized protein n=1 Tax=Podospora didyma TaxID=330526 RepID=A0AAE0NS90_9PEZI|nr:hypothetical protein B0H63DRAFT_468351 [Podospora didyma]
MATTSTGRVNYAKNCVGPLTAIFTGPSTCLSTTTFVGNGAAAFYVAAFWDDVTACYPTGTGTTTLDLHTNFFYSPGICPSGWAPVASMETDIRTTISDYSRYALPKETTAWLCCPSGFVPDRPWASHFWFETLNCASTISRGSTMTNVWMTDDPVGKLSNIVASSTLYVLARGIPIFWQSTDKAVLDWWAAASPAQTTPSSTYTPPTLFGPAGPVPTPSATGSTRATGSSTTTRSSLDSSTTTRRVTPNFNDLPPDFQEQAGTSLSTGAKAGISVSVSIAVIAIVLAVYFVVRLARARRAASAQPSAYPAQGEVGPGAAFDLQKVELGGVPRVEMQTNANVHEVASPPRFYELSGHQRF